MKKILLLVVTLTILCFGSVAMAASNGQILMKEEAVAEQMISALTENTSYETVSSTFAPELTATFDKAAFTNVKKDVKSKLGKIGDKKFIALQKFDQADQLTYLASFSKQNIVKIDMIFKVEDHDVKLVSFVLTPIEPQAQQQAAQPEQK